MSTVLKKKTSEYTDKLTFYVPKEIADIYRKGKYNNWDVSGLARSAIVDAFNKNRDLLLENADDIDQDCLVG